MFEWKEYLELAEKLKDCDNAYPAEATRRTIVSRAYYACFCHIRNFERDNRRFEVSESAQDHGDLKRHLSKRGKQDVARKLDRLRSWRNDADYKDVTPGIDKTAEEALKLARQVLTLKL